MKEFDPFEVVKTKYLFFTGKGGVGKTSAACATAVSLADNGKKVVLIRTDPASNLQDVFGLEPDNKGVSIPTLPDLTVANLDPLTAAAEYREKVISPYRGKLPESIIQNMEEQLSGSCTVEIAAFNEFSEFITNTEMQQKYDFIIFDTAPTGHTLRMLQLPSAWSNFISESTHGASCLGQLSGLESKKSIYKKAVDTLSDKDMTTLIIVTRLERAPLKEAERASAELCDIGICNQLLLINGILNSHNDLISDSIFFKQQNALNSMPASLKKLNSYTIPLRPYNVTGIENVRAFLKSDNSNTSPENPLTTEFKHLSELIKHLKEKQRKVIFTMGKGGVGKTTIAAAIALGLSREGLKVHLTTTDPAAHLHFVISESDNITMSHIDEKSELKKYQNEVLAKAKASGMTDSDLAYIEEDLRSPCTQEIAVFRAFDEIVEKANDEIVVIDTAPTGHTLLLLESTQSYNKEIQRTKGETPRSVQNLLPRLKSEETEVIIITLPEATPVFEATRLEEDLKRADIFADWWVINSSLYTNDIKNKMLKTKASNEIKWINHINSHTNGRFALVKWQTSDVKGDILLHL